MTQGFNISDLKEPRVLHLISSSGFQGAENVVLEVTKENLAANHWMKIGIFENQKNPNLELAKVASTLGLKVQIFPCRWRFDPKTILLIRAFIYREQISILHSHGYKGNFYALMATRGKIPWVVTNHNWTRTTFNLKVYALLDLLLIRFAKKVVTVSDEIASKLHKCGVSPQKIIVIDNGIDLQRFSNQKRNNLLKEYFGIKGKSKVIGTIARLTKEKGHIYLIEAAKNILSVFPDTIFLIVGDGNERDRLEKQVMKLGLKDKVIFTGKRKDIIDILSIIDIFVLPSITEGLPIALLEALASRLPVVATNVGAVSKVIIDRETGLLTESRSPELLSNAILELLSNWERAEQFGYQGYRKVEKEFSAKAMAEQYFDFYRKILSETS
jgi:glycosyltransferase involved in cell wall biosynthesis